MALSRVELLARGLARAQEMSGGSVPVTSLLDNPSLNSLSFEEKVDAIKHYAQLTANANYKAPGPGREMRSGAATALQIALPTAITSGILSGAFSIPTAKALGLAARNGAAAKYILNRTVVPIGIIGAVAAGYGALGAYQNYRSKEGYNRYLQHIQQSIAHSPDEETRRVNSAALLAATSHLSRGQSSAGGVGNQLIYQMPMAEANKMMGIFSEDKTHDVIFSAETTQKLLESGELRQQDFVKAVPALGAGGQQIQVLARDQDGNMIQTPEGRPAVVGMNRGYQFTFKHKDYHYIPGHGLVPKNK